jgi:hypothetical protein
LPRDRATGLWKSCAPTGESAASAGARVRKAWGQVGENASSAPRARLSERLSSAWAGVWPRENVGRTPEQAGEPRGATCARPVFTPARLNGNPPEPIGIPEHGLRGRVGGPPAPPNAPPSGPPVPLRRRMWSQDLVLVFVAHPNLLWCCPSRPRHGEVCGSGVHSDRAPGPTARQQRHSRGSEAP